MANSEWNETHVRHNVNSQQIASDYYFCAVNWSCILQSINKQLSLRWHSHYCSPCTQPLTYLFAAECIRTTCCTCFANCWTKMLANFGQLTSANYFNIFSRAMALLNALHLNAYFLSTWISFETKQPAIALLLMSGAKHFAFFSGRWSLCTVHFMSRAQHSKSVRMTTWWMSRNVREIMFLFFCFIFVSENLYSSFDG